MDSDSIQVKLAKVRQSYIESLTGKSASIIDCWNELKRRWNSAQFQELYIIIHSLAGSAGTFELDDISSHARDVVNLFKQHKLADKIPDKAQLDTAWQLIDKLLHSMRQAK